MHIHPVASPRFSIEQIARLYRQAPEWDQVVCDSIRSRIRRRSRSPCSSTPVMAHSGTPLIDVPRTQDAMLFLVWYDDSSKTPLVDKLQAAIAAYVVRFQTRPSLVLVNVVDYIELAEVQVRHERTIQPNTFWVGREDGTDLSMA